MAEITLRERFRGGVLGLALGDALGAPLEGGIIERCTWRCICAATGTQLRWTDDTQMSLDTAESLIASRNVDADDLAQRFADSYRWSRGYGPGAAKLLLQIRRGADWRTANRSVFPDGSFGNGAAMRSPVVGLFYHADLGSLIEAARLAASITHAHPLGIEGAVLVAVATTAAVNGHGAAQILKQTGGHCESQAYASRVATAADWIESGYAAEPVEVRKKLGNGIAAAESCITAIYLAARFLAVSFENMIAFVASCGGDVDTIGAMAGGIWGAANGAARLPRSQLEILEQRDRLYIVADELYERSNPSN